MANQQHIQWLNEGVEAWNRRRKTERFTPDFSGADLKPKELAPLHHMFEIASDAQQPFDWEGLSLRGVNLNGADLSHTRIDYADMREADLRGANLEDATLSRILLRRAEMNSARLNRVEIACANLAGADLNGANLMGARLVDVNLTGADLRGVRFAEADLHLAYVNEANLVDADLIGVTYLPSPLWAAKLYPKNQSPEQHGLESTRVETVGDLLDRMKKIRESYVDHHEEVLFYFRGERQCGWDLRPSVMRGGDGLSKSEGRMLVDLISRRPEDFSGTSSALTQWVLAQHHGLKTRFLDITSNPLVALFHACETDHPEELLDGRLHVFAAPRSIVKPFNSDSVSIVANFAKLSSDDQLNVLMPLPVRTLANLGTRWGEEEAITHEPAPGDLLPSMRRLYQSIRVEKPYFDERIDPRDFYRVFVVEPQKASERIQAQSGAFLVSAFHERFERSEILKRNPDIPIYAHYELAIPGGCKEGLKDELQSLNITRENLFPSLDESACAITKQIEATVHGDRSLSVYEQAAKLEDHQRLMAEGGRQYRKRLINEIRE